MPDAPDQPQPVTVSIPSPDEPPRRKRGRPRGSKNRKKRGGGAAGHPNSLANLNLHRFEKGHQAYGAVAANKRATAETRAVKVREREARIKIKYEFLTPERFLNLLQTEYDIAIDPAVAPGDRLRAAEFLIEQAVGKATSKLDVDVTHEQGLTLEDRVALFKQLTGLAKPQQQPQSDTVDGIALPAGSSAGHSGDRGRLPAPPAEVDLRHEEVPALPEARPVRVDVLPQLVVDQEAAGSVPRPEAPPAAGNLRLEEPEDQQRVHELPAEVGAGDRPSVAGADRPE